MRGTATGLRGRRLRYSGEGHRQSRVRAAVARALAGVALVGTGRGRRQARFSASWNLQMFSRKRRQPLGLTMRLPGRRDGIRP